MKKTYGTSAKCPKCGKQLYTSDIKGYSFVCKECDENFYTIEVQDCVADFWEINIPMQLQSFKVKLPNLQNISSKYKCDFLGYDDNAEMLDIGWKKGFPGSNILNQIVEEIENVLEKKEENIMKIKAKKYDDGCARGIQILVNDKIVASVDITRPDDEIRIISYKEDVDEPVNITSYNR